MTGDITARGRAGSIGTTAAVALALVMLLLIASALATGPGLADFWTIYLSTPTKGLFQLTENGWILDIQPPIFDGWATLLTYAGLSSAPLARLASNLPALILLVYCARRFTKRLPSEGPFYTIFLLLMLSAPATLRAFGIYRGEFWQLAAFTVQMMVARHIMFAQQDYRARVDGALALVAVVATFAAIALDYGGALFGGVLAMATALAAVARGLRRWARLLATALVLGVASTLYVISWQAAAWAANFDLYQNWIELGDSTTAGILILLLLGTVLHNPVAIAGAWLERKSFAKEDIAFAGLTAAALIASLVAIVQVDAQRRLITTSNTADIAVLATALMAAAGAKIAGRPLWMRGLALVAVLSAVVAVLVIGLDGGWQAGAKQIRRVVAACPATQVYAASGWRLDEGSGSAAAAREEPVFQLGYRRLGEANGFKPVIITHGKPVTATPGPCPTLLWIEQVPDRVHLKPDAILKTVGLTGLEGTRKTVVRTTTGLILRAER